MSANIQPGEEEVKRAMSTVSTTIGINEDLEDYHHFATWIPEFQNEWLIISGQLIHLQDPYIILEVPRDVTPKRIKTNFLKLGLKWHPDKKEQLASNSYREAHFNAICNAAKLLLDPSYRSVQMAAANDKGKMSTAESLGYFMNFCIDEIIAKQKIRHSPIKLFVTTLLPLGCELGKGQLGATLSPAFTAILSGGDVTNVLASMSEEEKTHFRLATRTLVDGRLHEYSNGHWPIHLPM